MGGTRRQRSQCSAHGANGCALGAVSRNDRKERTQTEEEIAVDTEGQLDPQRHLERDVMELMGSNILNCLGILLDTVVF
jgi:hypothetical protein